MAENLGIYVFSIGNDKMRTQNKMASIGRKKYDMHFCISCGHLLKIIRKIRKDKNKHIVGFRYVAKCVHSSHGHNPWIGHRCPSWVQMPGQENLIDYLKVKHGEDEDEDED